ncbi:Protein CBG11710 [Caenorhabditis briggsae]|uniref:Protein CBG11710 n=1 Tax=Caenorhabditis briggsae TaxID=6238 RepID=A8XDW8_CAEBR|nr:Protein CBG11710 [Caenorhabditis briggsae]CAP30863.2 Protein CBG11710 [Caenorhabditis briggsae]
MFRANTRQVIKTTDGETTVAIIEERSHILDGNSTDVRAWIEIDASDLINPTLLISSPEAVAALGLEVDSTAFQRFENVGLYLPGICSEYVPKAIDEFNSSSFEGTVSKAPRDVNASRMVAFDESPVYGGVAHKLGYKPKNGGFQ